MKSLTHHLYDSSTTLNDSSPPMIHHLQWVINYTSHTVYNISSPSFKPVAWTAVPHPFGLVYGGPWISSALVPCAVVLACRVASCLCVAMEMSGRDVNVAETAESGVKTNFFAQCNGNSENTMNDECYKKCFKKKLIEKNNEIELNL